MTDRYAVIGNPIGHSKSPQIHRMFAEQTGQDIEYTAIEGPLEPSGAFAETVTAFFAAGGRGVNVTAPFKLAALELADEVSGPAALAGAANALHWVDGRIRAENFDGVGLVRDIVVNHGFPMAGRRVLMLGAGGAARGAMLPFLAAGPTELVVANRTVAKAVDLVRAVDSGVAVAAGFPELEDMGGFDLVVNATSASMSDEALPLPAEVFRPDGAAYELFYGRGRTPFHGRAACAGVTRLIDGGGMLVEQAAEAFDWWRGIRPDTAAAIRRFSPPTAI